jgi:hypothetical protein
LVNTEVKNIMIFEKEDCTKGEDEEREEEW